MQQLDSNTALRNFSALVDFSNLVNSSLDLNFTLNNILLTCFGKFHTSKGLIALINECDKLEIKASKGISPSILEEFPPVSLNGFDSDDTIKEFVNRFNFPIVQEIKSSTGLAGILILGPRLTNAEYAHEDRNFLKTLLNVGATAIENSNAVERLKLVNRDLDAKVNQLSSLFDLSKEFSGILEVKMVSKILVYSLIGQMLVSKYAVVSAASSLFSILENRFDEAKLKAILKNCTAEQFVLPITREMFTDHLNPFAELGVDLIVPMQIKAETKGLILLGKRRNNVQYSRSDIEYVSSVGSLAIISIENARLFKETLEKQKLEKDLETARNIQNNLLPKTIPSLSSFEIAAYNQSARMVGGDYYDIIKLNDKELLFAIADVSGKGVQAALLMANIQAFLKSICKMKLPLSDATNLMNDLVAENTINGSFITFFWGILNDSTNELSYVNAGHNPPLLVRNGKITKLKKGGMILGVMQTIVPYLSETVKLESGDAVILFTDGITEAMDVQWKDYSDEKLEELAVTEYQLSAKSILDSIKCSVDDFTKGAEQSDDITCLVIKVK